jgi:phage gpG-like protein
MTLVTGLTEALRRLERIDMTQARHVALEQAATRIEVAVQQALSSLPGEDHATPWLCTGKLRDSVTHETTDNAAVIGSTDQVAVDQELGTSSIPPRPFLAPVAAAESEGVARGIADAIRSTIEAGR